ncbi:MAG: response regulator [Chloroflexota bacterium]|nr:response regulator [Chloroflexota bacterium]
MDEERSDFDENELSAEDLAVLRAFDAMEDWSEQPASVTSSLAPALHSAPRDARQEFAEYSLDDMLLIFIAEVEEDIVSMRRMLNQLEREAQIQPERFKAFRRLGHKIRGSASAIECQPIARIAELIEETANQIMRGTLFPVIGVNALAYTLHALEATLANVGADEDVLSAPLAELEKELAHLLADNPAAAPEPGEPEEQLVTEPNALTVDSTSPRFARVDGQRLERLLLDSERLAELHTPLESAQRQVDAAIKDLHTAQARLAQLEAVVFNLLTASRLPPLLDELPMSSLAARILSNAGQKNDAPRSVRRNRPHSRFAQATEEALWDELDIEHYTEQDLLLNALREAIAAVNGATSRVSTAFDHLRVVTQNYSVQATAVRNGTLLLRMLPLSVLVPRLREVIATPHIQFEVTGETVEIDQRILEAFSPSLVDLLEAYALSHTTEQEQVRVWLHARAIGNEIALEIGFSAPVSGGVVEPLQEAIQRLNGTLLAQRNDAGGVSFLLRFARSQGTVNCLLVRVDDQQMLVPFAQVQRIGDGKREQFDRLYNLRDLLDAPAAPAASGRVQPVLVLLQGASPISVGVAVDEVLDEVKLVVKPLALHLRRPGIVNAAVNGQGRVLLLADLPELIRHYIQIQQVASRKRSARLNTGQAAVKILLADDSVYLRQVLAQMLKHANYAVMEARDGLEALEQLIQHTPDVFLLDVEMPNLNGYDLLGIMRLYPLLAAVKIIMLTSRSSERHMQHALDLGAHAYLTKPCSQEMLLETIQRLLT